MLKKNRIQLLDCTLRDGGLGLEDSFKTGFETKVFDEETIDKVIGCFVNSNIEIIELGSIEETKEDLRKYGIYHSIESVSEKIPLKKSSNQMYVALFRGPDTKFEDIPDYREGYCEGIRVIIRYSELNKSLEFCKELSRKGYKVFVQPMLTARYTDDEVKILIDKSNEMNAYALYFVDSYGYMSESDVVSFLKKYDENLEANIRVGFHGHNNMNLAFSNAKTFINYETERNIILDSCILGMGQGAGNLQTEIITDYLNKSFQKNYVYDAILDTCEIIEKFSPEPLWGYMLMTLLPSINRAAYKYSINLRKNYKLSYSQINYLLKNIPEELRHRYTKQNLETLLGLLQRG